MVCAHQIMRLNLENMDAKVVAFIMSSKNQRAEEAGQEQWR